jgi:hypothetical protein
LADYILFKTGDLGPAMSINTIKQCAAVIESPPEWFKNTFHEVARWPLPDGSQAILYQASVIPDKKFELGGVTLSLDQLELPNVSAEGVSIKMIPNSKAEMAEGKLKALVIRAKRILYKGVGFENVDVELQEPQINLPLFLETQELQLLKLKTLKPRATLNEDALNQYIGKKAKWLRSGQIGFDGEKIVVTGRAGGLPIRLVVNVHIENHSLATKLEELRLGPVALPRFLFSSVLDKKVSLLAGEEMAYNLDINSIRGGNGQLQIN